MKNLALIIPLFLPLQLLGNPARDADPLEGVSDIEETPLPPEDAFNAVLNEIKTSPDFAGTLSELTFKGQLYAVDRRAEKMRTPGNPPPRLETLGSLLGGLSASTRGQIHINVNREYYENGTLKSETWTIDAGGSWETQTGMQDETGKQHK